MNAVKEVQPDPPVHSAPQVSSAHRVTRDHPDHLVRPDPPDPQAHQGTAVRQAPSDATATKDQSELQEATVRRETVVMTVTPAAPVPLDHQDFQDQLDL